MLRGNGALRADASDLEHVLPEELTLYRKIPILRIGWPRIVVERNDR